MLLKDQKILHKSSVIVPHIPHGYHHFGDYHGGMAGSQDWLASEHNPCIKVYDYNFYSHCYHNSKFLISPMG